MAKFTLLDDEPKKFELLPADEPPSAVKDVAFSIPGAIPRAAAGLIGLPQTLMNLVGRGIEKTGLVQPGALTSPSIPNFGDMTTRGYDAISEAVSGSPVYRPQTGPGRVADMTVQAAVGGPGSLVQKTITGAAAGLTGEAGRLAGVTNPLALGALQLLGASTASLPFILRNVPAANIDDAIKNIKPSDLQKAQTLMDDAARLGSPITGAEAIAQVTGKNSLQDIQRVVEASRTGGPIMQQMMNQRPDTARRAFESTADAIASLPTDPARTPVRMQQSADAALTEARRAGNTAAAPFYSMAEPQIISTQAFNAAAVKSPMIVDAVNRVTRSTRYGVFGEPPQSVKALNAAKQYLDDISAAAKDAGRNNEARLASTALDDLLPRIDAQVPAYQQARATVAQNRKTIVNPMQESPVGDIAATRGIPAEAAMRQQSEILMPQAPRALDPMTIKRTVATLNTQDPQAATSFVRQNLQAIFNESAQNLSGGANQWGGAKFAAQIAGNPQQKANLKALVEAAGGKGTWAGFNRLLDVLEAQGKRQAPGSQTAFNQQIQSNLSVGGVGTVPASIASPSKAMSVIGQAYDNFRFGKNTEQMAQILTDPRSVQLMKKLALETPVSSRATALTTQILSFQAPQSVESVSTPNR
jgi:hypothetical protein